MDEIEMVKDLRTVIAEPDDQEVMRAKQPLLDAIEAEEAARSQSGEPRRKLPAKWTVAAVVAVLAAMLVALLVGMPLLRLRGHFLALATLGLGIIVSVVVRELEITGRTSGIFGIPKPEINNRVYDTPQEFFWLLAPVVLIAGDR